MTILKEPEFLICRECESPCYTFEWSHDKTALVEAFCQSCGNDKLDDFDGDEEYGEEMEAG